MQTPVRRQVSWDPATVERPPVVKDSSWRSLQRAPSTPTTPSKHLLLAFGLDDAANSPTARRRRRSYLIGAICVVCACVMAGSRRRCRGVAAPRRAAPAARARRAPGQGHGSCHSSGMSDKKNSLRRGSAAPRLTVARLRKHIVKLVVLVVMGFSPLPFLLTFV